jgi:hypothetical protein
VAAHSPASPRTRIVGPVSFAAAGVLFLLYPALRPWTDASPDTAASAFTAPAWIVAHLMGVAGFALVAAGLFELRDALAATSGGRPVQLALGAWWAGVALVLPYYGAEIFALHAIGTRVEQTGDTTLLDLVEAVRMGPAQAVLFAAGLLLLAVAGVLTAVAVARSRTLPRWSGAPFAAGFALYLPQFFATPELRIAHGALVAVGCLVLAVHPRRV